jgi:hypothetical protein
MKQLRLSALKQIDPALLVGVSFPVKERASKRREIPNRFPTRSFYFFKNSTSVIHIPLKLWVVAA